MRILVTGGSGFVGRYVCDEILSRMGDDDFVQVVDIAHPGNPMEVRAFLENCDDRFDLIIHLAAIVGGRATIEGDPLKVATDLAIDSDLFQFALRTDPGRIVYFSSSAAYPVWMQEDDGMVLREDDIDLDDIASPDLTYGWAKLSGEMLAKHAEAAGLRVHVFRPFSGYGTDQALDYPFPSFIDRAKRKADPFEIWGDGNQVRDFIHITDIVNAMFAAIEQDIQGPVNLCSGRDTSFNELAELVTSAAGYTPKFKHLDAPEGVRFRVGDPTKMLSFYTPKISLEEGIQMAFEGRRHP